ncbi:MAG: urease accessory protein UreD [Deltaproteobacteria bacterium]|nr:urease accessory protein UreD [Deltaproteobacteria bacterium]
MQRVFYPEGPAPDGILPCEAYALHPPGGLVTGDVLEAEAECGPGAKALVTSPAAAKFYRAKGSCGFQSQSFRGRAAGPGAELEHLPPEAIVFSGARALQEATYEVSDGGSLIAWGTVLLGRAAAGEAFERGSYRETLRVFRDGRLALFERLDVAGFLEGGGSGVLASPLGLASRPVVSSFLALGPESPGVAARLSGALAALRDVGSAGGGEGYPEFRGATLRDGILVARSAGGCVQAAERYNRAAWALVRPALLGREAAHPRIWRT